VTIKSEKLINYYFPVIIFAFAIHGGGVVLLLNPPISGYAMPLSASIFIDIFILALTLVLFFKISAKSMRVILTDRLSRSMVFYIFGLLFLSLPHIFGIGIIDWLHYMVRNIIFYFYAGALAWFYLMKRPFSEINKMIYWFFIVQIVLCILILYFFFVEGEKNLLWGHSRLTGTMLSPNNFGMLSLFFVYWSLIERRNNLVWFVLFFSGCSMVFLSGSLSALIGLVLLFTIRLRRFIFLIFTSVIIYFMLVNDVIYLEVFDKIGRILVDFNTVNSVSHRVDQVKFLYDGFLSNPVDFTLGISRITFARFDSNHLNLIINFGLISILFYLYFAFSVINKLKILESKVFFFWFFIISSSLSPMMNRWNAIMLLFFALSYFVKKEEHSKGLCRYENFKIRT
jgi:hypothetical protein